MKALLEAGVHFGHQTRRWHPRMKRFIYTQRNGIHIIDLQQTMSLLERACQFITQVVAGGEDIIFVGTKKQAQEAISQEAQRCGMMHVNQRWLGGTLTNFATIRPRIDYLMKLEERKAKGLFQLLPKKEALKLEEKLQRLQKYLGGLKQLTRQPGALFVVDITKERIAVTEARQMGVPVVALVDTDCDPALVDVVIPGNDDAIRSIRVVTSRVADAVLEGLRQRESREEAEAAAEEEAAALEEALAEEESPEGAPAEEEPISASRDTP